MCIYGPLRILTGLSVMFGIFGELLRMMRPELRELQCSVVHSSELKTAQAWIFATGLLAK